MRHLTLANRMVGGFAVLLVIMAILTATGMAKVAAMNGLLHEINDVNSVKQRYAINFRGSVHDRSIAARDITLVNLPERKKVLAQIQALAATYQRSSKPLHELVADTSGSTQAERDQLERMDAAERQTLPSLARVLALSESGDVASARQVLLDETRGDFVGWLAAINGFIDMEEALNTAQSHEAREIGVHFSELMVALTLAACVLGVLVAVSTIRAVKTAVGGDPSEVKRVVELIGGGDLTTDASVSGGNSQSILASVLNMRSALVDVVRSVYRQADGVTGVRDVIAENATLLATQAVQQSAALKATSKRVQRVTAVVEANAENASRAKIVALKTTDEVEKGRNASAAIVGAMGAITHQSGRVGEIIATIQGIAQQTNILSLNAAVEAARAGAHGRGFAVVSVEIRSLAQRTAASAKEIAALLDETRIMIESGSLEIGRAAETMSSVLASVQEVAILMDEIATASHEQATEIQGIQGSIAELTTISTSAERAVYGSLEASSRLDHETQALRSAVSAFAI